MAKPILKIDIDDSKAKAMEQSITKFKTELSKMPGIWQAVGKENQGLAEGFKIMTASLLAQQELASKEADMTGKIAKNVEKSAHWWSSMASSSKKVLTNLEQSTMRLIKFTGITGGIAALAGLGGSLWGFDRLAHAASMGLRASSGLGIGYGSMKSFGLTYGRAIDTGSFLSAISQGRGNVASQQAAALFGLGVNPTQSGDTGQTARSALDAIRGLVKQTPDELLGVLLQSRKLAELGLDVESLRRIKSMTDQQYEKYKNEESGNRSRFGVDAGTLTSYQDFLVKLHGAGEAIEASLIRGLVKLNKPLGALADAFSNVIAKIIGSQGFEWVIEQVSKGLQWFADWITGPSFKSDIQDFAKAFGDTVKEMKYIISGLADIFKWMKDNFGWLIKFTTPGQDQGSGSVNKGYEWGQQSREWMKKQLGIPGQSGTTGSGDSKGVTIVPTLPNGQPINAAARNVNLVGTQVTAVSPELLQTVANLEGSPDINGKAQVSPAGAVGKYQIMPQTAVGLGFNPQDRFDPAKNEQMARKLLMELIHRYHGNVKEILADYNGGPRAVADLRAHGGMGFSPAYAETARYLQHAGFNVTIYDNTGGKVQTTVAQAATGQ